MIYDCFQFFNELDILKLRMNVLNDIVDRFVISESTVTFSGAPKPLYYNEHKKMFTEFNDKIIHNIVDDTPNDPDTITFTRDSHQKCAVARGLKDANPDDIIIFSDVDEIPNPDAVKWVLDNFDPTKIYALAQRNFYCYVDMEETSGNLLSVTGEFPGVEGSDRKWLGTKICSVSMLQKYTTEELRKKELQDIMIRVPNGGWHFSYMGGDKKVSARKRVQHKIKMAAHQEYNKRRYLWAVMKNIKNHTDILERDSKFEIVPIDESYPLYLREHLKEYKHLIYPKHRIGYKK